MQGMQTLQAPHFSTSSRTATAPPTQLHAAVERSRRHLLNLQKPDGHWVGELQGDTILESEYILLMAFLGREQDEVVVKAARYILRQQLPDGGWSNYPGGPAELSVSVKAYFALKLAGHDPDTNYMRQACTTIRQLGGAANCNSFTKFYLALLGEFPYENCPAVPPEMMMLPTWCWFNIHAMSSWTRTIVIPLSIFHAHKPVRKLPAELGIPELFLDDPQKPLWPHPPTKQVCSWTNFFLIVDQVYKWFDRRLPRDSGSPLPQGEGLGVRAKKLRSFLFTPFAFLRRIALRKASDWMFKHFAESDGVGAIYPPMIYTVICLKCLGYADDSPEMGWALGQLEDLMIEEDGAIRLQPCFSPVWDTALTLIALADAGIAHDHPAVAKGASWLLDKEVRQPGDYSVILPKLEPGGWFFEYRNRFYPDTDDTAMVLTALGRSGVRGSEGQRVRGSEGQRDRRTESQRSSRLAASRSSDHNGAHTLSRSIDRGLSWLLGMQNKDAGWAAFDRGVDWELLTKVPFADHNAMLDPSCPDITGRVLEALGHHGYRIGNPLVDRAIRYLETRQEANGSWLGRWGVNYIYGTWQVLVGLNRVGFDIQHPMVRKAVEWLKQVQQPGGGWGETCRSYDDPSLAGQGTPTASQTAWALLGLLSAGEADSDAVQAGIDYLLETQRADGSWYEEEFTGTGFPKVFYLKYHMYALYFPLMALARYERVKSGETRAKSQARVKSGESRVESQARVLSGDL